jgi:hypothetical protein
MRTGSIVALAALMAVSPACRSSSPVLVRLDMPGISAFPAGAFGEIIVAGFRNEAAVPDLDPAHELQSYLAAELRRAFKGPVSLRTLPDGATALPAIWREAGAGRDRPIFLTGSVRLESQIRKALQKGSVPVDGPFKLAGRGLIEQRHWALSVDLIVIAGETGEPLFRRTYREDRDYIDLEKPADFAFSELSARFRDRLFPTLLGSPTTEQRTLLTR